MYVLYVYVRTEWNNISYRKPCFSSFTRCVVHQSETEVENALNSTDTKYGNQKTRIHTSLHISSKVCCVQMVCALHCCCISLNVYARLCVNVFVHFVHVLFQQKPASRADESSYAWRALDVHTTYTMIDYMPKHLFYIFIVVIFLFFFSLACRVAYEFTHTNVYI